MRKYIRNHWLASTLVLLLLLFTGSWGTLTYVNTPGFCDSCHVMEPYYQSWKSSDHKKVACVDCHYPPGEKYKLSAKAKSLNQVMAYWTGKYNTKLYADVVDASCLTSGCHNLERLKEKPVEYAGKITFDHSKHYGTKINGMELLCTSCHSHVQGDVHIEINKNACFLCHFKDKVSGTRPVKAEFCIKCHNAPEGDIEISGQTFNHTSFVEMGVDCQRCHLDAIEGQGKVEVRTCSQCHDDPVMPGTSDELTRLHDSHTKEHKVDCLACHSEIKHGVHATGKQIQFSCEECHLAPHLGPRQLYAGTGGRGVEEMPSAMFKAQVDCVGCHLDEHTYGAEGVMKGEVMRPTVKGCVDCHGEMGGELYKMWQESIAQGTADTTIVVARAASKLATANPDSPGYAEAKKLVEDAQFNLDFVHYGKGIHNVTYALALLDKAKEFSEQAEAKLALK